MVKLFQFVIFVENLFLNKSLFLGGNVAVFQNFGNVDAKGVQANASVIFETF